MTSAMIGLTLATLVLFILLQYAFKEKQPVLFAIAGGISLMLGLSWYDTFETDIGMAISLCLIPFAFACEAFCIRLLFWKGEIEDDNE